ncbi:MAG: Tetratricopeptide repeat [Gemmatimonadota bacterium]
MPERPTSPLGPTADPHQLSFGALEGASFFHVERHGPDDTVTLLPVREPLVCGEWSYDDSEIEEAHFGDAGRELTPAATSGSRTPSSSRAPARPSAPPRPPTPARTPAPTPPPTPSVPRVPAPSADPLRAAFDATPGDTTAALALAAALERRGEARDALAVLDRAAAAGAEAFGVACARASVLGTLQRYAEAEQALRAAAAANATGAELLIQTGVLACRRARWKEAVGPLRAGTAQAPASAPGFYHLGEALNHTNDAPGALTAYRTATELDPTLWRAFKGMGIVLDRLGRSVEAAEAHRRAREAQHR